MDEKVFEDVGLTHNEVLVWKALLKLGSSTAGPLTRESGLHRSRVYEAVERLVDKGLVGWRVESNRKKFYAQNPEVVLEYLHEKEKKVAEQIPFLKALQSDAVEQQEAVVYDGYKGLKNMFENSINVTPKGGEILVFGARSGQDDSPETWTSFFVQLNKKRIAKKVKYRLIWNEDLRDTEMVKHWQSSKFTEARFLKQKTPAGVNIHGDTIAIILWKKKPYAFVITSKEVADSFREYFEAMWAIAKK